MCCVVSFVGERASFCVFSTFMSFLHVLLFGCMLFGGEKNKCRYIHATESTQSTQAERKDTEKMTSNIEIKCYKLCDKIKDKLCLSGDSGMCHLSARFAARIQQRAQ